MNIRICPDCGHRLATEELVNAEGDTVIRLTCDGTCAYRGEWQLKKAAR